MLNAQANEQLVNATTRYAKEARRFDTVSLSPIERRQMQVLENSLTVSAPPDPKEAEELTRLLASMEGAYGSGKYCPPSSGEAVRRDNAASGGDCLDIEKITEILAENRDPKRLQDVWEGWHTISLPATFEDYLARFDRKKRFWPADGRPEPTSATPVVVTKTSAESSAHPAQLLTDEGCWSQ